MLWAVEATVMFTEIKPTVDRASEQFRCNACGATVSKDGPPQHRSWHEAIRQIAQKMS